ncbi:hypothetical protein E4634_16940 [Mangrovimicrobium sediminis]|uniref:DUF7064 domain-containing protein n=1 Tax=Mangrovimicrobium sediminis TaxID=2562682 RepID=A0A4Z0LWZ1_9GAMM|nr:hypothetical protein [Haliea sp. SAOS-164]TGD71801.1 hypothetical protein E4634_16940 [Haliea sp. SAOS-164]
MQTLPVADRFCDNPTDNPYWNESVWFSVSIPERHIHGMIQYYFRPNMNMLNGGPILWDASGLETHNCRHYNWAHLQALPPGMQKFDMRANNSLAVKVLEPLTRYSLSYDHDDLQFELEWNAIGPLHELKTGDAGQTATAKFHIEQPGRMTGTLRSGDETFAIDCLSMRDTSFGQRDYASLSSGGYFWGIADNSAFHAIAMGKGREQKVIGGFIWKDGELSSMVSGTRSVEDYHRLGPKRVTFTATDKLGRTVEATGEIDEGFVFTGYTDHTVVWSLLRWDWDGVTHWGDNQEFAPALRFRRIARGDIVLGSGD